MKLYQSILIIVLFGSLVYVGSLGNGAADADEGSAGAVTGFL